MTAGGLAGMEKTAGLEPVAAEGGLAAFWELSPAARERRLWEGIATVHAWHFEWNLAYRQTVAARGVQP
ncbi:MAG: hypothetical protein H5T84_09155, partial [Thermoleophilia bacterium]|nr:hypothetical protein [Thermoleophilia bacterium]